jgi:F-type H+-transporting ATPase subunit delta
LLFVTRGLKSWRLAVEYSKLFDIMNGVEVAQVTTAIAMDAVS